LTLLQRRHGETLEQLLSQLDQAIAKSQQEGAFIDEINSWLTVRKSRRYLALAYHRLGLEEAEISTWPLHTMSRPI
jgi:hypothetical protein